MLANNDSYLKMKTIIEAYRYDILYKRGDRSEIPIKLRTILDFGRLCRDLSREHEAYQSFRLVLEATATPETINETYKDLAHEAFLCIEGLVSCESDEVWESSCAFCARYRHLFNH